MRLPRKWLMASLTLNNLLWWCGGGSGVNPFADVPYVVISVYIESLGFLIMELWKAFIKLKTEF